MNEERRLLEEVVNAKPARLKAVMFEIDAFLAQPEPAAREAVLAKALRRMMDYSPALVPGCDTPPKRVFMVSAQEQADAYHQAFDALADISSAAAALLAQGERIAIARGKVMMIDASPAGSLNAQLKAEALAALAPSEKEVEVSDG